MVSWQSWRQFTGNLFITGLQTVHTVLFYFFHGGNGLTFCVSLEVGSLRKADVELSGGRISFLLAGQTTLEPGVAGAECHNVGSVEDDPKVLRRLRFEQ